MDYWAVICQLINELLLTNEIISIWYNGDPSPKNFSERARKMCFFKILVNFF